MLQLGYGDRSRRRPFNPPFWQENFHRLGVCPHRHEILVQNLTEGIRDPDLVITVRYTAEYKGAVETDLSVIHFTIAVYIVEGYKVPGKRRLALAVNFSSE